MKCPNCKANVPKQYMYCPQCGLSVKAARASGRKRTGIALILIVGAGLIGGGMFARRQLEKGAQSPSEPDTHAVAEVSAAETTAAVTEAPPETTVTEP